MKIYRVFSKMSTALILIFCVSLIAPPDMSGQALNEDMLKNLKYRAIGPTRRAGGMSILQLWRSSLTFFMRPLPQAACGRRSITGLPMSLYLTMRQCFPLVMLQCHRQIRISSGSGPVKPTTPEAVTGGTACTNRPMPERPGKTWGLRSPIMLAGS